MNFFKLKKEGFNISDISRITGRDRKTVSKYLKKGKDKPPISSKRKRKGTKLDPFKQEIKILLEKGEEKNVYLSAVFIYERIVKQGYNGSLSLLRKYIQKEKQKIASIIVPIIRTLPGEQAQVDWGEKYLDTPQDKRKKVYIFCMSLGYSGTRFVRHYPRATRYYFLLGHIEAFRYYGGVPENILYDQTRCAVDKPGFGRVVVNKEFYEFANYYGFHPVFCKPRRARTKGKVESLVKYVKNNFLPLKIFEGFDKLNQEADEWLYRVNNKVHSTTERIPLEILKEERDYLISLPEKDYELFIMETRKVLDTSTISFGGKYYSVPPDYLRKRVTVKYRPEIEHFSVYFKDKLLCNHKISKEKGKYVILKKHRREIWAVWHHDLKLFYRASRKKKTPPPDISENIKRPLSFYEEVI